MNERTALNIRRILGICVAVGIVIYLVSTRREAIVIETRDGGLSFSYSDLMEHSYGPDDIISISITDDLNLGSPVDPIEQELCLVGIWENEQLGKYAIYAYPRVDQFIILETTEGYLVFNQASAEDTADYYAMFVDRYRQGEAA